MLHYFVHSIKIQWTTGFIHMKKAVSVHASPTAWDQTLDELYLSQVSKVNDS